MKKMLGLMTLLLLAKTGWSQEVLNEYKWGAPAAGDPLAVGDLPKGAVVTQLDGRQVLKIENTNDAPLQVTLLTIANPKITATVYELTGEVRYDSVKGDGYLEMWNYFPPEKPGLPEGQYFSRTMAESGPMGKISSTSDWREFTLPFDRTGASESPTRLKVNLVLPGNGTVFIAPVKLLQLPKAKSASGALYPDAWWSAPASGKIFGWGGAVIGCLGGLCGTLAGLGKGRTFVLAVLWGLSGLGAILGLGGFCGIAVGQPFFVWLPMLFTALLLLAICPVNLRQFRRKYEEIELRRMASLDATGA